MAACIWTVGPTAADGSEPSGTSAKRPASLSLLVMAENVRVALVCVL